MPFSTAVRRRLRRGAGELVHRGWLTVQKLGAIHPGSARSDRFGALGEGSLIGFPMATLFGESGMHIGRNTLVAAWTSLSVGYPGAEDRAPARGLVIGDDCVIGMRCAITAHESVVIGNDVWFGQDVFVTDANHGLDDDDVPIGRRLGEHRPVRIGDGAWLGHGSVVLPGVTIGDGAVIAAGAVVRTDVPARSVAAGVPARIVKTLGA